MAEIWLLISGALLETKKALQEAAATSHSEDEGTHAEVVDAQGCDLDAGQPVYRTEASEWPQVEALCCRKKIARP